MSIDTSFQQLREANPVPNPTLLTNVAEDLTGLLDASKQRSTEMQTQERTTTEIRPPRVRRPWVIALAAATVLVMVGLAAVIANTEEPTVVVDEPAIVVDEPTPTVTSAPVLPPVDIESAFPTQVQNDQASRATIEFAGDARALVEGAAHSVEIRMEIEANTNSPTVRVNLTSVDGVITSTGETDDGATFTPTWSWTPDGDKVVVTMVGRGVRIPDTRPTVVVIVQETSDSEPVEFVLTAPSGSGRPG